VTTGWTWLGAGAIVLAAGLSGCGAGSSSGYPTSASKTQFCDIFTASKRIDPPVTAEKLAHVGTPSDISAAQRHGFEVLVEHLRKLPSKSRDSDLTVMVRNLKPGDGQDLQSFLAYMNQECGGLPTAPPS
jgi:hypothetical protein